MKWCRLSFDWIFCCPYSAILCINISCQLEMSFICPQNCPLPCEQEIQKLKCLLLTEVNNFAHISFCNDFAMFQAPSSEACSIFGHFPVHCTVPHHYSTSPALLWLLLQLPSNQLFSFFYQSAHKKKTVFLNF